VKSAGRPRARRLARTILIGVAGIAAIAVAVIVIVTLIPRPPAAPGAGTTILASTDSKANEAVEESEPGSTAQDAAQFLSDQPTAVWLTPEAEPIGEVADRVRTLADEAREQNADLAVVIYGMPERDCGSFSAGGLEPEDYSTWTAEIGGALRAASDLRSIVILEPDSLAQAPDCGNIDDRTDQLSAAIDALRGENIWIYLDAGHSQWLPADEMASLISQVGDLGRVRGFATNVSNYNATDEEIAYAHKLSTALGGLHAIVDTSRNGAGSNGEWCNPTRRLVGDPGGTVSDDVVDTNLWIKAPGESDGTCNGGPRAGAWWPKAAIELTRDVRG
jgi:endoglucanase